MPRLPTHVAAIALMTIDLSHLLLPTSPPRGRFDHLHVVGYGLLSHRVRPDGRLSFMLDTYAGRAGASERELADRLEDDLTQVGLLTGYDLLGVALPLLLSVTSPGDHLSLAALASAPPERFCDLIQRTASKAAVTFDAACLRAGVETIPANALGEQMLWSFGVTEHMIAILSERAIAAWKLWMAQHADRSGEWQLCFAAVQQLDAWLEINPLPVFDRYGRRLPTSRQRFTA